jgi:hypothetical protein
MMVDQIPSQGGLRTCQTGVVSDAVGPHPQYDEFADDFLDHARDNLYTLTMTAQHVLPFWVMLRDEPCSTLPADLGYAEEPSRVAPTSSALTRVREWSNCADNASH